MLMVGFASERAASPPSLVATPPVLRGPIAWSPVVLAVVTRVFSGIKPTGDMHLGNYLGAVRRWVDDQPPAGSEAAANHDAVFCVVDLHALTAPYDPAELTAATRRLATVLLASGIDPQRSLLFVQSHVRAHAELTWLLNCTATFGELRRMTQFKEKSDREGGGQESVSVGLFDYPVLMAADILLYDTDEVPVGDDQRQHVELTRDIATRFNYQFGDVFTIPKATFPPFGARIMDLQDPTKKMSKSDESPQGTILVLEDPKAITKKIKSAVTDSETSVRHDREAKPGISNLIEIYATVTDHTILAVEKEFADGGYGTFKGAVAEAVVEYLRPVQARFRELDADRAEVDRRLAIGAGIAAGIADPVLARATKAAGLLPRAGS
jgi:tryptophanyl-tRNA synthetase